MCGGSSESKLIWCASAMRECLPWCLASSYSTSLALSLSSSKLLCESCKFWPMGTSWNENESKSSVWFIRLRSVKSASCYLLRLSRVPVWAYYCLSRGFFLASFDRDLTWDSKSTSTRSCSELLCFLMERSDS